MPIAHTHKNTTLRLVPCDREQLIHFFHWLPSSPQKVERIGDAKGLNYSSYSGSGKLQVLFLGGILRVVWQV
jgi:hypothetical protein